MAFQFRQRFIAQLPVARESFQLIKLVFGRQDDQLVPADQLPRLVEGDVDNVVDHRIDDRIV